VVTACIGQSRPSPKANRGNGCAPVTNDQLNCPKFGFTYKIPIAWVDRTRDIEGFEKPGEEAPDQDAKSSRAHEGEANRANNDITGQEQFGRGSEQSSAGGGKSQTLLAIFERPPEAPGETINSAVVFVAESRDVYPQVKTAADYFGAISDLAEQQGLKATSDPYAFAIGAKQLVREDFGGQRGKLPIFQSTLAIIEHGEIVSFTFVGGSEDEVDELIDRLTFTSARR